MKGVSIRYGDVAPEAKESFIATSSETQFGDRYQVQFKQYNMDFPNWASPCEYYQTSLDGTATAIPSETENAMVGLWSTQLSDEMGNFATEIILTLVADGNYASEGLTFTFDTYNQIFPTELYIEWYRGDERIDYDTFYPDEAFYFCKKKVTAYNKVIITFNKINMPYTRLRLQSIEYGYGTFFKGDELRNVNIIQEIDPISSQISVNVVDFTLDSNKDVVYSFTAKQPLSVYWEGNLVEATFVTQSKRLSKKMWKVQSEDYIGLMQNVPFYGGMYNNTSVEDLLNEIFLWQSETNTTKIPYQLEDELKDETVTGYIPITNCRDALMQVAFAIQAVVDTSNSSAVRIYRLRDNNEEEIQHIPLNRIKQGQNFEDDETVTSVSLTAHEYVRQEEDAAFDIEVFNNTETGETGKNIFVIFEKPCSELRWTSDITMIKQDVNYCIFDVEEGRAASIGGKTYVHNRTVKEKRNENALANEVEKIITIENATLVSARNVDNVLNNCYNWLVKTRSTNLSIVEGKHVQYGSKIRYGEKKYGTEFKYGEKYPDLVTYDNKTHVGENISAETEYLGIVEGRIIKQKYNLNGNILVKESVVR